MELNGLGKCLPDKIRHLAKKGIYLHGLPLWTHAAGKGQNLPDEFRGATHIRVQHSQNLLAFIVCQAPPEHIDRDRDGLKNVVQVMGDAAGQIADTLLALRAESFFLEEAGLGGVLIDDKNRLRVSGLVAEKSPAAFHDKLRAGRRGIFQLSAPLPGAQSAASGFGEDLGITAQFTRKWPADRFESGQSIESLGTHAPIDHLSLEVLDDDRLFVPKQKLGLFACVGLGPFALRAVADGTVNFAK